MIFHNVLEKALGSPIKIKILKYLLLEGVPTSEREISRILGVSHTAINRAMKCFEDLNLATRSRIGSAIVWRIKETSYLGHAIDIFMRSNNPPLDELKGMIQKVLKDCNTFEGIIIKEAFIFGSIAEGKEEANSDIDLFVVVDKKKGHVLKKLLDLEDEIYKLFGNRLSIQIMNEEEYHNLKKQQKILIGQAEKGIKVV